MKASHRDLPGRSLGIEPALAARYGLDQLTVLFYHYNLLIGVLSRLGTWVPDRSRLREPRFSPQPGALIL